MREDYPESMNEQIIKSTGLLNTILESMASGVFLVNLQGQIIFWNRAAEKITGYSREEMIGKPCGQLPGESCREGNCEQGILTCGLFTCNDFIERECQIIGKDGRVLHLMKSARVVYDDRGKPLIGIVNLVDVTRIREADQEIQYLRSRVEPETCLCGLIGSTPVMHRVFSEIRLASQSDTTVLITGESGTGKELAAMAVHRLSRRRNKPIVTVNCCSLPESLLESELFGHVKGAFTGAIRNQIGRFEAADGGTVFIDEIGELPLVIQLKLLRFLQTHVIERIGETTSRKLDVRIISATNRDLQSLVEKGLFREDLYYRINVFPIRIPALRDRKKDIVLLVDHFLKKFSEKTGKKVNGVQKGFLDRLMEYDWPGNVRELENTIEYAFVRVRGGLLRAEDLPENIRSYNIINNRKKVRKNTSRITKEMILEKLAENGWHREQTANALGISRITLWKKMKAMGLLKSSDIPDESHQTFSS